MAAITPEPTGHLVAATDGPWGSSWPAGTTLIRVADDEDNFTENLIDIDTRLAQADDDDGEA